LFFIKYKNEHEEGPTPPSKQPIGNKKVRRRKKVSSLNWIVQEGGKILASKNNRKAPKILSGAAMRSEEDFCRTSDEIEKKPKRKGKQLGPEFGQ